MFFYIQHIFYSRHLQTIVLFRAYDSMEIARGITLFLICIILYIVAYGDVVSHGLYRNSVRAE